METHDRSHGSRGAGKVLADLERERIPTVAQARADLLTREPEQKPEHAKEKAQEAVSLREEAQATPTQENAPGTPRRRFYAHARPRGMGHDSPPDDRAGADARTEPTHERHGWRWQIGKVD